MNRDELIKTIFNALGDGKVSMGDFFDYWVPGWDEYIYDMAEKSIHKSNNEVLLDFLTNYVSSKKEKEL